MGKRFGALSRNTSFKTGLARHSGIVEPVQRRILLMNKDGMLTTP